MIGCYLKGTKDKGILLLPDESKRFECWVDVDFAGNLKEEGACKDPMTAKSRSDWVITETGFYQESQYSLFISRQVQEFKNYQNPSSISKDTYKTILLFCLTCFVFVIHLNLK